MAISRDKKNRGNREEKPATRIIDWIIIIPIGLVALFVFIGYMLPPKTPEPEPILPDAGAIRIQLFGGCSRRVKVLEIGDLLREHGVDVTETVNSNSIYPYSLVVDRIGNRSIADSLKKILGLPDDRVILQRRNMIVDATVVIGLDYPSMIDSLR